MKVTIDESLCIGCELCVQTCPAVFMMDGEIAITIVDSVPKGDEKAVSQAADECPVEAIAVS